MLPNEKIIGQGERVDTSEEMVIGGGGRSSADDHDGQGVGGLTGTLPRESE